MHGTFATHAHHFLSVQTTPQTIHDLLVEHQTDDAAATLLVIETCDVAGWVHDIAMAQGSASRWLIPRTKRGAGRA